MTEKEKLYHVWYNMMDRCYNEQHPAYSRYGGRGIVVCDHWKTLQNFKEWALEGYCPGLWLDRENNNGDYDPYNCRWIHPSQSRDNVKGTVRLTAFDETKTASQWAKDPRCAVKRDTLVARIKYGYDAETAITTPAGEIK